MLGWSGGEGGANARAMHGLAPVSYTHLDVYKRQGRAQWRRQDDAAAHDFRPDPREPRRDAVFRRRSAGGRCGRDRACGHRALPGRAQGVAVHDGGREPRARRLPATRSRPQPPRACRGLRRVPRTRRAAQGVRRPPQRRSAADAGRRPRADVATEIDHVRRAVSRPEPAVDPADRRHCHARAAARHRRAAGRAECRSGAATRQPGLCARVWPGGCGRSRRDVACQRVAAEGLFGIEHFQEKWRPVFRLKCDQPKKHIQFPSS